MQLVALGLNHTTAPLAVRERVAFEANRAVAALRELKTKRLAREAAILSTCNRTELYIATEQPQAAVAWLAQTAAEQGGGALAQSHFYTHPQDAAVRHAFRVAAGLDSMVLGEPQILGQMKEAARIAEQAGSMGTLLHQLFQKSFAVAKDVRSQTAIGAQSVSMAAACVKLALRIFPTLTTERVLFIGAGEMIELTATHFAAQSPRQLTVANRTIERAHSLAQRFNGMALKLADLPQHLHEFDVVVSCTASSLPIVGLGAVERAVKQRRRKPIFMVDLAVPRDIEPEVARLDDVFLYTVDDLAALVREGVDARRGAVAQAEALIETQVHGFMHWLDARQSVPAIQALRAKAEGARQTELERAHKALQRGDSVEAVLEALSQGLTNKLMHAPTAALGQANAGGSAAAPDTSGERDQTAAFIKRIYSL